MWVPKGALGDLRKVESNMKPTDRWNTIDDWYHDEGVLVMGYEMFRALVHNKKTAVQEEAPIDEAQHTQLKMQITEGPNIIIADEAHKMKNAASAITAAASLFKSRCRIALTGSPLANNVTEYHTMVRIFLDV